MTAASPAPASVLPVVLDANALLLPFTDGTDVRDELERELGAISLIVPACVDAELDTLAAGGGQTARAAVAAKRWSRAFPREATTLPGDDGVLEVARRLVSAGPAAVCSNDRNVQQEALRSGLVVVASRGPGRLARRHA